MGLGARNYLVPIDANLKSADDIRAKSIDLTDLIGAQSKAHPNLNRMVIPDACRTDPERRGVLNGEAAGFCVTDAPSSLISFSTSLGKRGPDGASGTIALAL